MTTKPEFKLETLAVLLDKSVEKYAQNIACSFTDLSHKYSYFSVKEKCEELSSLMSRKGVGSSDRVLILSENRPEWTIAMFSATAYGRVMVPVLPDCSFCISPTVFQEDTPLQILISQQDFLNSDTDSPSLRVMELYDYINERIIPCYATFDPAHREDHARDVMKSALQMARYYDVDKDMVAMAAACHDLGLCEDRKTHHLVSGRIIRDEKQLRAIFERLYPSLIA